MTILTITIGQSPWSIHINEDPMKRGCLFVANEIWANGSWQEVGADLTKGLAMAIDIEYKGCTLKPDICPIVQQIMKITRLSI